MKYVSLAVLAISATSAHAVSLRFDPIVARFDNPVMAAGPGVSVQSIDTVYGGNVSVAWGSATQQSSYDFDAATTPLTGTQDIGFTLGQFTHNNHVIPAGMSPESVELYVQGTVTAVADDATETLLGDLTFSFLIDHLETSNDPSSCPLEAVPCADHVSITPLTGSPQVFEADGMTYSIGVEGFLIPGTREVSNSFSSAENDSTSRELIARFTAEELPSIPLPASMPLLFSGLFLLGVAYRARR